MNSTSQTETMSHAINRAVMLDAWAISYRAAKRFGYPAKDFIGQALKQAWAKFKAAKVRQAHPQKQSTEVYTVCIDERLANHTKLLNQLAVEAYFTDKAAASVARDLLAGAFHRPFIKTSRACGV